ncbi:hypothetical protein KCU78_g170, partial [Aureobasidium melanogenum]
MLAVASDGCSLLERFEWVIHAARSANPNIKIVLEQFYGFTAGGRSYKGINGDQGRIDRYKASVATFFEGYHNRTLPSLDGSHQVSARIDGIDFDVGDDSSGEGSMVSSLSPILTAIRIHVDAMSTRLNASRFSISICSAWTNFLDGSVDSSCDHINMQNYSGGVGTSAESYTSTTGVPKGRMSWGLCSEEPRRGVITGWDQIVQKIAEVNRGGYAEVGTWRLNPDNYPFENMFQVFLYNQIHGTQLRDMKSSEIVGKWWPTEGRVGGRIVPGNELV